MALDTTRDRLVRLAFPSAIGAPVSESWTERGSVVCCVQMGPERRRSAAMMERDDRGQLERVVRDFRGGVPILSIRRPIRPIRWAWLGLFRPFEGGFSRC